MIRRASRSPLMRLGTSYPATADSSERFESTALVGRRFGKESTRAKSLMGTGSYELSRRQEKTGAEVRRPLSPACPGSLERLVASTFLRDTATLIGRMRQDCTPNLPGRIGNRHKKG